MNLHRIPAARAAANYLLNNCTCTEYGKTHTCPAYKTLVRHPPVTLQATDAIARGIGDQLVLGPLDYAVLDECPLALDP